MEVSQRQNTEFPKVYNSVNLVYIIVVYKESHGNYDVNYVAQISTSTYTGLHFCKLQSLEVLCFGPVFTVLPSSTAS